MNPTKEMERNGLHPEQMPTKKKSSKSRHLNPTKKMEKPDHIRSGATTKKRGASLLGSATSFTKKWKNLGRIFNRRGI